MTTKEKLTTLMRLRALSANKYDKEALEFAISAIKQDLLDEHKLLEQAVRRAEEIYDNQKYTEINTLIKEVLSAKMDNIAEALHLNCDTMNTENNPED